MTEKTEDRTELVIALVGAVGTSMDRVRDLLVERLKVAGYVVKPIKISREIIPSIAPLSAEIPPGDEYARIKAFMDAGNEARKRSGDNSILALGTAAFINSMRLTDQKQLPKPSASTAYIVSSLKHPEEVARLREIYPQGFYLIGVHSDESRRQTFLTKERGLSVSNAQELMERDKDEHLAHGQRLIDTFHLSDFFLRIDGDVDRLKHSIWRILNLVFGDPYVTPTFDEYAMFLAFAASLRSADMSRQVGAVVAFEQQVLSTGANDCPRAGGGLYWPEYNPITRMVEDQQGGRDYTREQDPNKAEQTKIIAEIVHRVEDPGIDPMKLARLLEESRISDLTEFGRVVHAEMEALLSCSRAGISAKGAHLYCTTFPCHNCAKHIVAAGIRRVVFIEPYQKSKAAEFHPDSIKVGFPADNQQFIVSFEPFVGVGPRRFFDLFSMRLGSGYPIRRNDRGFKVNWRFENSCPRLQMHPTSYLDLELLATETFEKSRISLKE